MRSQYQRRNSRTAKLEGEDRKHKESLKTRGGSASVKDDVQKHEPDKAPAQEPVHSERFSRDKGYGRGETATGTKPLEEPTISSTGKDVER